MKRILSVLFAALLCFAALPIAVSAKAPVVYAPEYLHISVPQNEAKKLKLEWPGTPYNSFDDGSNKTMPTGFVLYRSESGKSGTFEKIATTKKTTYTDSGLKNGTVYFYRVRGFVKSGGKTYYSKYTQACGCTKLTNKQATKLLQKAYRMAGMWMDLAQPNCSKTKHIKSQKTITYYDGTTSTFEGDFYLVTDKTFSTKKQIKKYLGRMFDQQQVNAFVDGNYIEKNGRLWMYHFDWGDGEWPFAQRDRVIYLSQGWNTMQIVNITNWGNDDYMRFDPAIHMLEFRNGRWIFTDEYWFAYRHFINLE